MHKERYESEFVENSANLVLKIELLLTVLYKKKKKVT